MTSGGMYEKHGREFAAGTVLFREGEPGQVMYVIQSGRVKIWRQVGAQEALLAMISEGEFFGEMALISGHPRSATATVVEDSRLLVLDSQVFESMIRSSSEVAIRMIKKLADRLDRANNHIEILLHRDPSQRVVQYLRQQSSHIGTPGEQGVHIPVQVQVLAERVGLSIHEVQDVIGKLEKAKLVRRTGETGFEVPELSRLQDFLDFLEIKERFGGS